MTGKAHITGFPFKKLLNLIWIGSKIKALYYYFIILLLKLLNKMNLFFYQWILFLQQLNANSYCNFNLLLFQVKTATPWINFNALIKYILQTTWIVTNVFLLFMSMFLHNVIFEYCNLHIKKHNLGLIVKIC